MDKNVFLCILLCSAVFEVQCLKCYVCDNCEKVKEEELQTCGAETTTESSMTTLTITPEITERIITSQITTTQPSIATAMTEATTSISTTTKRRNTPTTDKAKHTTTVPPKPLTIATTETAISTEETIKDPTSPVSIHNPEIGSTEPSISAVFTKEPEIDATSNTTEFAANFTLVITDTTTSSSEPTNISETVTKEPTIISTSMSSKLIDNFSYPERNTTETTRSYESTTNIAQAPTKPKLNYFQDKPNVTTIINTTISTITSASIIPESALNLTSIKVEATSSSYPILVKEKPVANPIFITETSSVISAESTTNPILTPDKSTIVISTLNVAEPATDSTLNRSNSAITREPPIADITTESENTLITTNTEPITTKLTETQATTLPKAVPFMITESARMPLEAITSTMEPATNKEADNLPFRNVRSVIESCVCYENPACDCSKIQRLKRYALRRRPLQNEELKYICVVDKFQVNGTEIVKRGCAALQEDPITSCLKSGFRANCKTCNTDQCNGSSMIRSSVGSLLTIYFITKLMI